MARAAANGVRHVASYGLRMARRPAWPRAGVTMYERTPRASRFTAPLAHRALRVDYPFTMTCPLSVASFYFSYYFRGLPSGSLGGARSRP
jgi:hypothetical protein